MSVAAEALMLRRLIGPGRPARPLASAIAGPSSSRAPAFTPRRLLSTSQPCYNNANSSSSSAQSRAQSLSSIGAPVFVGKKQQQSNAAPSSSSKDKGPIRDEDIQADQIFLVDFTGAAGGGLTGPFPTRAVLGKIDRKRFWLQQVSAASNKAPSTDGAQPAPQHPVCKLISKKDEYDKARAAAKKKAGKTDEEEQSESPASPQEAERAAAAVIAPKVSSTSSAPSRKEVQLTWASTAHDISYKIAKAKRELLKGGHGSRLTVRISHKGNASRDVGPPGSPSYLAAHAKRKEFLKTLHPMICQDDEHGGAVEPAAAASGAPQEEDSKALPVEESMMEHRGAAGATVPGGVARISQEGVQWKAHGQMAVMVYEQVPQK